VGDDYFLTSGDKIRYFLEEDGVDSEGKLVVEKHQAVNKIGHALHELDPAFRKVTLENQRLKDLVTDLKFHKDPVALQSMVIIKQPYIGAEVPEHNDSTFLVNDFFFFWSQIQPLWLIRSKVYQTSNCSGILDSLGGMYGDKWGLVFLAWIASHFSYH